MILHVLFMPTDPLMNLGCTSKYPTTGCVSKETLEKQGVGVFNLSQFSDIPTLFPTTFSQMILKNQRFIRLIFRFPHLK